MSSLKFFEITKTAIFHGANVVVLVVYPGFHVGSGNWPVRLRPHRRSESAKTTRTFFVSPPKLHQLLFPTHPYTMSHHARIEEVSDSDPDEVAPSDMMAEDSIIERASIPIRSNPPPAAPTPMAPPMAQQMPEPQREIPKHFQCLYPIYFDKTRSRVEGRKVGSELAVENPLARDIMDAVQMLGLQAGLEPEKLHPKDWANPGRVRVHLKNEDGRLVNPKIKNSKCLNARGSIYEQLVYSCMTNLHPPQSTIYTSLSLNT